MITSAYARLRAAIPLLVTVAASMSLGCSGAPAGPERAANVTMRDLAFDPGTIELHSGERVRLGIRNEGALTHDFTVEAMPVTAKSSTGGVSGAEHDHQASTFALHLALAARKAGALGFTPTKAGEYAFWCTVAGHREAGMSGTLRVD
ncbi:MAG: hypothetical protein DWI59_05905 [Chloroflexi bacterium]|nr:MAG: hypothetical protein DWI59_05905 [Chloroflexota bacterium]